MSPTTVAHHHMLISQTLNMAIRRKWMAGPSPADDAGPPKVQEPEPYAPTPEDAQAFIRAWMAKPETRSRAALLLLDGITGCRRGEVAGWQWTDFDQTAGAGALAVRRSITVGKDGPVPKLTKTKRARRVSFTADTVAVRAAQWEIYVEACKGAGLVPDWDSYVFSDKLDHVRACNAASGDWSGG